MENFVMQDNFFSDSIVDIKHQNGSGYKTANLTKRRILQNGEFDKTAKLTKRRILQNGEFDKTANLTKRRIYISHKVIERGRYRVWFVTLPRLG